MAGADGEYQFRFAGFARAGGARPFHVIGVGNMTLKNGKDIEGYQWSTRMPMQGVSDNLLHRPWKLSGGYVADANNSLLVTVGFALDDKNDPNYGKVLMKD